MTGAGPVRVVSMLAVGDPVPDFSLRCAYADGRRDFVSLSDLLQRGPVVLQFFPLAFTRVCTVQMCDARDNLQVYDRLGAQVFGFCCDTSYVNVEFAKTLGVRYGFLSDPNREVVDRVWATAEVAGVKRVPKRGWMVIGRDGRVADQWMADNASADWVGTKPIEAALACLPKA